MPGAAQDADADVASAGDQLNCASDICSPQTRTFPAAIFFYTSTVARAWLRSLTENRAESTLAMLLTSCHLAGQHSGAQSFLVHEVNGVRGACVLGGTTRSSRHCVVVA